MPHVLRWDGLLEYAPDLAARIEREELLLIELSKRANELKREREHALEYQKWQKELAYYQNCRAAAQLHDRVRELNTLLADHGGFEHNRQSLRVVDELEKHYPDFNGLNLKQGTCGELFGYGYLPLPLAIRQEGEEELRLRARWSGRASGVSSRRTTPRCG